MYQKFEEDDKILQPDVHRRSFSLYVFSEWSASSAQTKLEGCRHTPCNFLEMVRKPSRRARKPPIADEEIQKLAALSVLKLPFCIFP